MFADPYTPRLVPDWARTSVPLTSGGTAAPLNVDVSNVKSVAPERESPHKLAIFFVIVLTRAAPSVKYTPSDAANITPAVVR
jgi:hypothetical protein